MNKTQQTQLDVAATALARAVETNDQENITDSREAVKNKITAIYNNKTDVTTVLQVEQILSQAYANVLENSPNADKRMGGLTEKATDGLETYQSFSKAPQNYVKYIDMANKNIGKGEGETKRHKDGIPIEPIRAAFIQFRKELTKELSLDRTKQIPLETQTALVRFDATIKAERLFLEEYLAHRNEPEQKKQEHLREFDKRMEKEARAIDPQRQERPQERQRELPKQEEKQQERKPIERTPEPPKRSRGLSR